MIVITCCDDLYPIYPPHYIARTFPCHPYFECSMEGQMVLRNVLHSYAVADRETGYCQGLSFVTGILLIHVSVGVWCVRCGCE